MLTCGGPGAKPPCSAHKGALSPCTELDPGQPQVCRHARMHAPPTRHDTHRNVPRAHTLRCPASTILSQPTGKQMVRRTAAALQAAPGPKGRLVCRASGQPRGSPGLGGSMSPCASVCTSVSARGGRVRVHTRSSVHRAPALHPSPQASVGGRGEAQAQAALGFSKGHKGLPGKLREPC